MTDDTERLTTTERRIRRRTKVARDNLKLIEALNMTDGQLAGNLGKHLRTVQKWGTGRKLNEDTLILLHVLATRNIDLRAVRKELGLEVF